MEIEGGKRILTDYIEVDIIETPKIYKLKDEERKDSLLMTGYNDTIPLIFFSENGRKTIVKAIIESTPDAETLKQMLTQKDSNGNNALIYALRNDNEEAMQILIDHLIDWTGK